MNILKTDISSDLKGLGICLKKTKQNKQNKKHKTKATTKTRKALLH